MWETFNTILISHEVGHNQTATKEIRLFFDNNKYFDYPKSIELIKQMIKIGLSADGVILDFFRFYYHSPCDNAVKCRVRW